MGVLSIIFGLLLGFAAMKFQVEGSPIAEKIDSILPQIQCGQCGFSGCLPYAEAVAAGDADIDRCLPGGTACTVILSKLLSRDIEEIDTVISSTPRKMLAKIDEENCVGCTFCMQACPVDAILGTARFIHTVIATECTGCGLCILPCPMDCIHMEPVLQTITSWKCAYPVIGEELEGHVD
jgi:electron transport complex protein RnfB